MKYTMLLIPFHSTNVIGSSSSQSLKILISAENDNTPIFELDEYTFNVSENVPGQSAVGTVRAHDLDLDTIKYSINPTTARGEYPCWLLAIYCQASA